MNWRRITATGRGGGTPMSQSIDKLMDDFVINSLVSCSLSLLPSLSYPRVLIPSIHRCCCSLLVVSSSCLSQWTEKSFSWNKDSSPIVFDVVFCCFCFLFHFRWYTCQRNGNEQTSLIIYQPLGTELFLETRQHTSKEDKLQILF